MTEGPTRKKQPELVRRALLDSAARIALEQGWSAVTIQAVAKAANVTKGGLFHHFASKQALIEAMFNDLLEKLDQKIDDRMARDDKAWGRFTRAYVDTTFLDREMGFDSPLAALWVSASLDPSLRALWLKWLDRRLECHRDSDADPMLQVARLAADGAWFSFAGTMGEARRQDRDRLYKELCAMTVQA